jgi:glycine/D-amino acid oxidase-like deaminating enzyme
MRVAVLGAGLQGVCAALNLSERGCLVDLFESGREPISRASLWNEGKIHLGFVFAHDRSLRTAKLMITGSLHFTPILSRWIPEAELAALKSLRFHYLVPHDSLLSVDDVDAHLRAVKKLYAEAVNYFDRDYFGADANSLFEKLPEQSLADYFNPEMFQGGFCTAEIALDVHAIGRKLRSAIAGGRGIRLLNNTMVESIQGTRNGPLHVTTAGAARPAGPYNYVVNALWSDRLRIDATFGITTRRPWLYRRKVALHLTGGPRSNVPPSTTMVLGPYGDVVNFGNGNYYLSWYPLSRIDSTRAISPPPDWTDALPKLQRVSLRKEIPRRLCRFIPSMESLFGVAKDAAVEGGTIFAWGRGDIDTPATELHQRHDIGVHSYGCYHSIDTGKYCMAPYFADQLAETIAPRRRVLTIS